MPARTGKPQKAPAKPPLGGAALKLQSIRQLTNWHLKHDALMLERNQLVCQAWDADIPVTVIASLIDISVARVYQIKDGK